MSQATLVRSEIAGPLLRYRIAAFTTGFVLLAGTIMLILKAVGVPHMEPETGWVWVFHGWFFLVYVALTFLIGLKMRWPLLKYLLVMVAGTIPTMSFVAEHYVMRDVRARTSS